MNGDSKKQKQKEKQMKLNHKKKDLKDITPEQLEEYHKTQRKLGKKPAAMGPGRHMAMMKSEKAKDLKGSLKKLFKYMAHHKKALLLVIIFAILSTTSAIVGPKILGRATTRLFEGVMLQVQGIGKIDFEYIGIIILTVLGLYIISTIFLYIQGWIMSNVSTDVSYRLRKDLSQKINKLPLKYFDKSTHGEVLSRISNDVDTVNQSLSQSMTQIITSVATLIGVLIMMFSISVTMTLVTLITIPMSLMIVMLIVKKSQKYFIQQQKSLSDVNGHVEEMYGAHVVVKSFNGEQKSIEKFEKHNEKLYSVAWKSAFLSGLMMPMIFFIGNLGYVLVAILGGYFAVRDKISIGDIQAFIQYVRSFTRPLNQVANISNVLQQTAAAAERVFEFLDEDEEIAETKNPIYPENIKGHVEFRNINFGYNQDKIVINNFSAEAHPGQKIAIVGPTGAGKTTIVKLLMRFYELNGGEIYIDSIESKKFTRNGLRSIFGMVLQDTWLYNDTLRENIRYARPDATDEEVIIAAQAAHVDHFIHTLPDGYDMIINEEMTNISQGQKQLLTIARAVLANPKILILDEATSSVDTRTELLIQKAMDNLMKNRTSFVIAHRLSTIRDADLILVMRDGDIVEQGNHETLLAKRGFYAELHNSQFEKTPEIQSNN